MQIIIFINTLQCTRYFIFKYSGIICECILLIITDYHVEKLLRQLSLEKYWPVFDKRNIRYNDFLKLSEQDLKDIGIK